MISRRQRPPPGAFGAEKDVDRDDDPAAATSARRPREERPRWGRSASGFAGARRPAGRDDERRDGEHLTRPGCRTRGNRSGDVTTFAPPPRGRLFSRKYQEMVLAGRVMTASANPPTPTPMSPARTASRPWRSRESVSGLERGNPARAISTRMVVITSTASWVMARSGAEKYRKASDTTSPTTPEKTRATRRSRCQITQPSAPAARRGRDDKSRWRNEEAPTGCTPTGSSGWHQGRRDPEGRARERERARWRNQWRWCATLVSLREGGSVAAHPRVGT